MISFENFRMEEGVPIYPQIIGYIERGVVAGAIRSGDEMPSRRTLSALLGVNPNTVQKAYRMLEEEGLITSHTGAKSYVSADAGLVERIRGELVEETVRGAAAAPAADGCGPGRGGGAAPAALGRGQKGGRGEMKRHGSVLMLAARGSLGKALLVCAATAAAELGLFWAALGRAGGAGR